ALLWSLNPLLLHQLVAGGHLDSLLALLVVAAVLLAELPFRRAWRGSGGRAGGWWGGGRWGDGYWGSVASGAVFGVAGLVKATAAAPAAGVAVALLLDRGRPGDRRAGPLARTAAFVAAGAVVAALGYTAVGGLSALTPTRDASRFVSRGTPWRFVASGLEHVLPHDTARTVVGLLALVAAVLLAVRISRALPIAPPAASVSAADPTPDSRIVGIALAASVAWLVLAPYSLPWYDAIGWALLALLVVGGPAVVRVETLLLLHTAFLSVAYLPGRVVGLTDGITTAQDVVRGLLAPIIVTVVAFGLAWLPRSGTAGGAAVGRTLGG
ncbi:MAG TPA: hypothetical protein VLR26_10525, partial [Frankiaceae bacterium]|nr:hypothetical protein [Frankiaceae bacterium]